MKIAQIAPLIESVPPKCYGGTERVVSYLTEELVSCGHEVTLFASGDSITAAELVPCTNAALRLRGIKDPIPYYLLMLDKVRERIEEFDVLHFHIDQFHFPIFRPVANRTLTTLHGRQDLPDLNALYRGFSDMPLVSISDAQREAVPTANYVATVHHGLPTNLHMPLTVRPRSYFAFLGRICEEKGVERAIEIARAVGMPLKIAAKVDRTDETYFRERIAPLLGQPGLEFVGEINEHAKTTFLGEAAALLFPIDWPEPFGLVMIEAMACGTPILAFCNGSVPEIIDQGVTGHIVDSVEDAIAAIERTVALDRQLVRRRFEERFVSSRMAQDYVDVYDRLLGGRLTTTSRQARARLQLKPVRENGNGKTRCSTNLRKVSRGDIRR